jgi:Ca-activated chloride channel homolog
MKALIWAAYVILQLLPPTLPFFEPPGAGSLSRQQNQGVPQPDFTIRTNTVLVTVEAVVRNEKGGFVGNLQAEDFAVYDNGVAQQVISFSREELPLAVALVVDRSPSVQPYMPQLRAAALTALQRLKPEDRVALFSFDMNPAQFTELSHDRQYLAQMIGRIPGGVGTDIYDALYDAARYLHEKAPDRRRAIILISDNYQSVQSANSIRDVLQEMLEAGATLYSIKTRGDNPGQSGGGNPEVIARLARETGGEVLNAESVTRLPEVLDAAVLNLKQGYTLGFTPSTTGEEGSFHKLEVKLNPRGDCTSCKVQARSGYYVGGHAPSQPGNLSRDGNKSAARRSGQPHDLEELIAQNRILTARNSNANLGDIDFEVRTYSLTDPKGKQQVQVDVTINGAQVLFKIADGLHIGRLRITVFQQNESGGVLGAEWKTMDMRLRDETYRRVLQSGIPYSTTLPLQASKLWLKVVVYDPWSDKIGSRAWRMQR